MDEIYSGISCNLDKNILAAALPLFQDSSVEAIEWSFDALFNHDNIPGWFEDLLQAYGAEGRLIGHGVYFSLFSGNFSADQQAWLRHLQKTTDLYKFDHITEHFGFMTGEDFHKGAPLSVPLSGKALSIAQDRISRMRNACGLPVGLENLAFSYDLQSLKLQGEFLRKIVDYVDGFIILDLHNLYCQIENFNITFKELIGLYPLELVREIHISGGSWEDSKAGNRKVRRDTHDSSVPEEVFNYLQEVIPQLPNLKFVILEQLGSGLETQSKQDDFQEDFRKMRQIVSENKRNKPVQTKNFLSNVHISSQEVIECKELASQQSELSDILENAIDFAEVKTKLMASSLRQTPWQIECWEDTMLETAYEISQKWKHGFS